MSRLTSMSIALLCVGLLRAPAQNDATSGISDEIVKKVDPSVVAIQHETAGGSGFIISKDGYILTNGHVVQGRDQEDPTQPAKLITVILWDERKFPAKVVGFNLDPDVALLKIEVDDKLRPVEFGDSMKAQIGQRCFAVGTPVGLKRTFTRGILSNVDRSDLQTATKVFQTDAAINSGNSGGPLFDSQGRVLGINTYASRGKNNLGFTIPIHFALTLKEHFMKHGRFVRSDIPLFFGTEIYDELAETLGVEKGILVEWVMAGTPAEASGIQAGDVIVRFDGKECSARTRAELLDFDWKWSTTPPGKKVKMQVLRGRPPERTKVNLKLTMEEMEPLPAYGRQPGELKEHRYEVLGLGVKQLVRLHRIFNRLSDAEGVLVTRVVRNSPADKADLDEWDIITHVQGHLVTDIPSFQEALENALRNRVKAITITTQSGKSTMKTALAPYYDLNEKRVALVLPETPFEHLALVVRELEADGAKVQQVTAGADLADLKGEDIDILILADGDGAKALWSTPAVLRLVKEVHDAEHILAGMGTSSLAIALGDESLLDKKMTTSRDASGEAMARKANYTGNDVERDGNIITTTAFDRATVRQFLKALRILARNSG